MSWMKGDLLSKTRKLVGGLVTREPLWLKAMEASPPPVFPRSDGKIKKIVLPEDKYVRKFSIKYPESKIEDPLKIKQFEPDPARVYGWRVVELKEQGVSEEEAMVVAEMEYRSERKRKKEAYKRLKELAKMQGKKHPPKPYISAKEIQAPMRKYGKDRNNIPSVRRMFNQLKDHKGLLLSGGSGGAREKNWVNK